MELKETIPGMLSDNFLDRLIAERDQVQIRLDKLRKYLKDTTSKDHLLIMQNAYMSLYLDTLNKRLSAIRNHRNTQEDKDASL